VAYTLVNQTTTDTAQVLECGGSVRVNADVFNAAIIVRYGQGRGSYIWGPPVFYAPAHRSLDRACDAIEYRNALPGLPAQLSVEALTPTDLGDDGA
jgi:hypothetical protein